MPKYGIYLKIFLFIFILFTLYSVLAKDDIKISKYKLEKNNLIIINNPSIILSSAGFIVNKGAKEEPPDLFGISHLWEHLFFRNIVNNKFLKELLADSYYNASTYNDYIVFYAVGDIHKILEYFIFAIKNPNFDENSLNLEKQVVITELSLKNYQDEPNFFEQYTNPTGGTIKTVSNISFNTMKDFAKNIKNENLTFFVITNKEFEDFKIFNNNFQGVIIKEEELSVSLEKLTNNQLYENYRLLKNFINDLSKNSVFKEKVVNQNFYLFNNFDNYRLSEIFFLDLLSKYLNELFSENNSFRKELIQKGVEDLSAIVIPQKLEISWILFIRSKNQSISKEFTNVIKQIIISKIKDIDYQEFIKIYEKLYLETLNNFSNSWQLTQLVPYFIYNNNWELINYYTKGVVKIES